VVDERGRVGEIYLDNISSVINTPTYFNAALITFLKSFIALAQGRQREVKTIRV